MSEHVESLCLTSMGQHPPLGALKTVHAGTPATLHKLVIYSELHTQMAV